MKNRIFFAIVATVFTLAAAFLTSGCRQKNVTHKHSSAETGIEKIVGDVNPPCPDAEQFAAQSVPDAVCMDSVRNRFRLPELAANGKTLIYRYSDLHCHPCYDAGLELFQKTFAGSGSPVAILASYQSYKTFLIFTKVNRIGLPIYWIEHKAIDWPVEKYNAPYYFLLSPDGTATSFHIAVPVDSECNMLYLKQIKTEL